VLADYDRPNALPTFLVEANYEFEHNAADEGTPEILRRLAYWAMLSGARGQLYGNRYTGRSPATGRVILDTTGSAQMAHVRFSSLRGAGTTWCRTRHTRWSPPATAPSPTPAPRATTTT
jgi:hypothetical protein